MLSGGGSVGDMSLRTGEAERVGSDAGGGGCARVNLEALLGDWIVFGEWKTRPGRQPRVRVGEAGTGCEGRRW